jgi:hypothetical protein
VGANLFLLLAGVCAWQRAHPDPMSSTPLLSEDDFYRAARSTPAHPLELVRGYRIILGQGEELDSGGGSTGSRSQKSGVVVQAVRHREVCVVRFDGDQFDTELCIHKLQSLGYSCPGVEHRGDEFCKDVFEFSCQKNHGTPPRSAYKYYCDLHDIGFDYEHVTQDQILQRGDKSALARLIHAPPPGSSEGDTPGDLNDLNIFTLILISFIL